MPLSPPLHRSTSAAAPVLRLSAARRGYDRQWEKVRAVQLAREPLCRFCAPGRLTAATIVDHIQPIEKRPDLRLSLENLRSLCKSHHDQRTADYERGIIY